MDIHYLGHLIEVLVSGHHCQDVAIDDGGVQEALTGQKLQAEICTEYDVT